MRTYENVRSFPSPTSCARAFVLDRLTEATQLFAIRRWWKVPCLLCGRHVPEPICDDCRAVLPLNERACRVCALPLLGPELPDGRCGACFAKPPPFGRTVAAFRYDAPLDRLIHRVKFGGGLVEADALGALLAETLADAYRDATLPEAIVPVPLSWRRLVVRGHNQATSIARVPAKRLGLPILHTLCRRVRHTSPQTGLSRRARIRNLAHAFDVRGNAPPRVAIFDDVMTTGATARALSRVLLAHGAADVHVWVVARTRVR